ncbi:MAG: hypothetical protein ACLQBB_11990 [Solirubrobacteraceae bacterium]
MAADRSRYGLLVSALGAVILIVAVFLPWYGFTLTQAGAGSLVQAGDQFAAQFGNPALQSYVAGLHGTITALGGQQIASETAHQAFSELSVVMLVLAGLAMLDALFPLARAAAPLPDGAGGAVVLLGLLAGLCVLYRMVLPPSPAGGLVDLSLREGAWLALLGSMMMVVGGLWPRTMPLVSPPEERGQGQDIWASLSGWTPGA